MPRIRIDASEIGTRKEWSSAQEEFLRFCRLKNLTPKSVDYYRENLKYIGEHLHLKYVDEFTKEKVDDLVLFEMEKGNRVTAINARIRGLRVFVHFCADEG